tara:strand:+ start:121 stop:264 length:144 start_codon:yes stop_codon:yes gene_type:complete
MAHCAQKLWVEQPENFPTALALKPYPRSQVRGGAASEKVQLFFQLHQ